MWNSGWAVVVVVALVIVALFGYWAIEGDFERGGDTARVESNVNVARGAPAPGTGGTSETNLDVNIDRDRPAERPESRGESRLEADADVEGERARTR